MFCIKLSHYDYFQSVEVLGGGGHGSGTQLQLAENLNFFVQCFNPFSPHDALKHHFTSLKTDLIFLQPGVLERKFL